MREALAQEAAELLARGVGADRAAVFVRGPQGTVMSGVVGVSAFAIIACPFSVPTVDDVIDANRNLLYTNAPDEARENQTLRFSGAISMLCVPFYDQAERPIGALYADTTLRPRAFHRKELLFARDCATWLEAQLAGIEIAKPQLAPAPVKASPPPPATPPPSSSPPPARPSVSDIRAETKDVMIFFRSLASLTRAGVHIDASLRLLGTSSESKAMREVAMGLSEAVFRGEPISSAMDRYPETFAPPVRSTVRVGERTGRLVQVLDVLSTDLEKSQRLRYRMRSALTYPAFLGIACGLMLLFGPPYLLQGHLKVLADSGVPLPLVTQGLLLLSKAMGNPLVLFGLGAAVVCGVVAVRSRAGREKVVLWARRTPVIGKILALLSLTEVARSLAMQTRAGLSALEALSQARLGCQDPKMVDALRMAEERVRNGDTLAEAFAASKQFSTTFVSFIEAGEQTGTLVRLTEWLADFYEAEMEAALTRFVAMAEPVIMAAMGAVAAVLMVATIKPTILILQAL